jgi:hypothetical protein
MCDLPVCGVVDIGRSDVGVRCCQCRTSTYCRKATGTRLAGCADARLDEWPHAIANPGEAHPVSLRRIVTHMIEETARHAGHVDIVREQIDGATGP